MCTGLRVPCCGPRGEHQREHHPEGRLGRGIGKSNLEATITYSTGMQLRTLLEGL